MVVSSWVSRALVAVEPKGGSVINMHAKTKGLDISGGEYDFKSEPNLAGGRMVVFSPESDYEVTIDDIYFTQSDYDALILATGLTSKFAARVMVRCTIAFAVDAAEDVASEAITGECYRMVFKDGYVTSFTKKFEADTGVLVGTLKMKFPIRDLLGSTGNGSVEYNATSLPALSDY